MNNFEIIALKDLTGIAKKVALAFGKSVIFPKIHHFLDSEVLISFGEDEKLRGRRIFVVESVFSPIVENLFKTLLLVYELKQIGVKDVCIIFPYLGYMRQDKAGGMKFVAQMIQAAGASSVFIVEMHSENIKTFFSIPAYNISLSSVIAKNIKKNFKDSKNLTLVSPDRGAKKRTQEVVSLLGCDMVVIEKKRIRQGQVELVDMSGECLNKDLIIIDDIIDSAGTAVAVSDRLLSCGAKSVSGYFVHPVFSNYGLANIKKSSFKRVFVSNTIPMVNSEQVDFIEIFDCVDSIIEKIRERV
jgi:ribose-phosphate pyrophosphokinase